MKKNLMIVMLAVASNINAADFQMAGAGLTENNSTPASSQPQKAWHQKLWDKVTGVFGSKAPEDLPTQQQQAKAQENPPAVKEKGFFAKLKEKASNIKNPFAKKEVDACASQIAAEQQKVLKRPKLTPEEMRAQVTAQTNKRGQTAEETQQRIKATPLTTLANRYADLFGNTDNLILEDIVPVRNVWIGILKEVVGCSTLIETFVTYFNILMDQINDLHTAVMPSMKDKEFKPTPNNIEQLKSKFSTAQINIKNNMEKIDTIKTRNILEKTTIDYLKETYAHLNKNIENFKTIMNNIKATAAPQAAKKTPPPLKPRPALKPKPQVPAKPSNLTSNK